MPMSVHSRIWGMVGLFVFSLLLTGILYVTSERETLLAEKKLKTRQLVELAVSSARHYYQLGQSGQMSDADAKAAALQSIRAMRYGGGEYFWIQDADKPVMIMHATQPELDGQRLDVPQMPNISAMQAGADANGSLQPNNQKPALVIAANQLANAAGSGFLTYEWPRLTASGLTRERYPKLSFVEKFAPWNWVIGTGTFIDDIDAAVKEKALHHLGLLAIIGSILAIVAAFLANSVVRPLRQATARLHAMSRDTAKLAPLPSERNDEIGALIAGYNQLQAALHKHEEELRLAASVFDNALEGIMITDAQANIIQVNPSFSRLTGYSAAEVTGRNPRILASGKTPPETFIEMWTALNQGRAWHGELVNQRKDRTEFIQMASIAPVLGAENEISHFIGVIQDITAQKALARQLEEEAHRDYLTGLANRRYFIEQAELELARARRYNNPFSVAMLDLDHFKTVNDSHGHEAGDQLLRVMAEKCLEVLRDSDLIGRYGGEEFAILFPHLSAHEALEAAERLREEISHIDICTPDGQRIQITASLGVAELSPCDRNIDALLRRADQALYEAKNAGRNQSCFASIDEAPQDQTSRHGA